MSGVPPVTEKRLKRVLRPAANMFRSLMGNDSMLEERIRRALRITSESGPGYVQWSGPKHVVVQSTTAPEPRTGIYLRGACDLPKLLSMAPLLRRDVTGTIAVADAAGAIAATRADVLLQTLDDLPAEATKEVTDRLGLRPDYFEPTLFSPTFVLPNLRSLGPFPKTVVVLSLAPNVVRTVYRHREYGFLVDPGGLWLNQDLDAVMRNTDQIEWFSQHFEQVGRLSVDEFVGLFATLIRRVKEKARPRHILVSNVLTVEPGERIHNYQLRKNPEVLRRQEFCLALVELSRDLGFHIVDLDRILRREGIDRQVDFAHFPNELSEPISADVFGILRALEVV